MAPLCCKPAVIVVQPTYHSADVEGAVHRVEDVGCAWYTAAMGDCSAGDDWSEEFRAFFEAERFEAAADSVEEDIAGCFVLLDWSVGVSRDGW